MHSIYTGALRKLNELPTKDINSLYMVYDEETKVKSIYHGTEKVDGNFIIVNSDATETP